MSSLLARARAMFGDFDTDKEVISMYQRYIRSRVSSKSCAANGKKGYAALVAAGKGDVAGSKAAEWRFDHPSDLELIVMQVLNDMGLPVDRTHREVSIGKYYVDFKYNNVAIEVNDDTWHDNGASFKGDVEAHDQGKYNYLRRNGISVVVLAEKAVRTGEAAQILYQLKDSLTEDCDEF